MPDPILDVERAAVQRLLDEGNKQAVKLDTSSPAYDWWCGYCRALEHVLEMEDQ